MNKVFILFWVVLFSTQVAFAKDYFVSVSGNDSNNGLSIENSFKTIPKAISLVVSGDIIYVRGGTHPYSATISITKSGSASAIYSLLAYPGERPVLDFSTTSFGKRGISLSGSYWHIKGFDFVNAGDNGMIISGGGNNTIEFCSFIANKDSGLQLSGGAHDNQIINCDSYYNADPTDYGDADGFACKMDVGSNNSFYGCRSWLNVDDGWDGYLRGTDNVSTTLENCWTWMNGYFKDETDAGANANGNGFKMGGSDDKLLQHNFTLKNCMSFDNKGKGFDQNNNKGSMILYNCSAYHNNGNNFSVSAPLTAGKILEIKNCLSADNKISLGSFAIQVTNSWLPPFTVSAADFASLDTTGVSGPRKPDGSLPDVPFLHLAKGSDLIDHGTDIGLPFKGILPDLGAFESDFSTGLITNPGTENELRAGFFHDDLIIRFNNQLNESFQCSIVRLNGQVAFTSKIETFGQAQKINCSQLSRGFYILKLSLGSKQWEPKTLVKMN
ncbi:MAG TPA: right-handed parallel beta-helix repeat-containing protein [Prolixibacteraceae bacterium]